MLETSSVSGVSTTISSKASMSHTSFSRLGGLSANPMTGTVPVSFRPGDPASE